MTDKALLQINPSGPIVILERAETSFAGMDAEARTTVSHYDEFENMAGKKSAKTKGASLPPNWWSNVPLRRYMF